MKKKLLGLLTAIVMACSLTSCNMNIGFGSFSFKKVHITTKNCDKCVSIESWKDDEFGIEVKTKYYGSIFLSEGTYILIEDTCPICGD